MKLQERIHKHKYQSTGRMSKLCYGIYHMILILRGIHQIVQLETNSNFYIDVQKLI